MDKLIAIQVKEMILQVAGGIIRNEPELTTIDRKIGDGDHGIGMKRGFEAVKENLTDKTVSDVGNVFQKTGMALLTSMGGASGVLFSSLFLGCFKKNKNKEYLTVTDFAEGLSQGLSDIKKKGGASVGDKTMIDSLEPAVQSLKDNPTNDFEEALSKATKAAQKGVEETKEYVAKFGRAKNLGKRSLGYQDAGATSVYIILNESLNYIRKEDEK